MSKRVSAALLMVLGLVFAGGFCEAETLQPARISDLRYLYTGLVKKVNLGEMLDPNGSVRAPEQLGVRPGTVLVDENRKTALFVKEVHKDGTLAVRKPTMQEVFADFAIPRQKVVFNDANIIDLQPAIRDARLGKPGTVKIKRTESTANSQGPGAGQSQVRSGGGIGGPAEKEAVSKVLEGGKTYDFDQAPMVAYCGDQKIEVQLSGSIRLNLSFTTEYSAFSGYDFGIEGAEAISLKTKLSINVDQEVYLPLLGVDVPCGGIAGLRAGIFLVLDVHGNVTLVVLGEEGASLAAGVKGSTKFGVPTSFGPYEDHHFYVSGECDPNGTISAGAYLTPSVTISALGMDVVNAEIRLGFYAHALATNAKVEYGLNAVTKFGVAVLGEGVQILDMDLPLFNREKEYHGGYVFYGDLCAFRQDSIASVWQVQHPGEEPNPDAVPFSDKNPYAGKVQLCYYKHGSVDPKIIEVEVKKEDHGRLYHSYADDGITVEKGDSVRLAIPDDPSAISQNFFSTIPFRGIILDRADFFNEVAIGRIEPVSALRDIPGWSDQQIRTDKMALLYCHDQEVELRFTDKSGLKTKTVKSDQKGEFISAGIGIRAGFDIRPFSKAVPYANIHGFELEGNPIDTTCGVMFKMVTDYRTDYKAKAGDGRVIDLKNPTPSEELTTFNKIALVSEEFTSGDHFIAVNKFGAKKITNKVDYYTDVYYEKAMEEMIRMAIATSKAVGKTTDMRATIMDDKAKLAMGGEHTTIALDETKNGEFAYFRGTAKADIADAANDGRAVASAHAYHRYAAKVSSPAGSNAINLTDSQPAATMKTFPANAKDTVDHTQPAGVDAELTFEKQWGSFPHTFVKDSIYVDTRGAMDIEGYRLVAVQAYPWIITGEDKAITGQTAGDVVDNFIKQGLMGFKQKIIDPTTYANRLGDSWKPAAGTTRHEVSIDVNQGTMSLDGIRMKMGAKGSVQNGNVFVPAGALANLMGGVATWEAKTGQLKMSVGANRLAIASGQKTAMVNNKTVNIAGGVQGTGAQLMVSADMAAQLRTAKVTADVKTGKVAITYYE